MTVTAFAYDDGEDVATADDGFVSTYQVWLDRVRAIGDPATRRAVMALFVIAVLHGRTGR